MEMSRCIVLFIAVVCFVTVSSEETCELNIPDFDGCTWDCIPFMKDEKFYPDGKCVEVTCVGYNSTGMLGCPQLFGNADCFNDINYDLKYPDCCPYYTC